MNTQAPEKTYIRGPYRKTKPAKVSVGAKCEKTLVQQFEQALEQMGIDRKSDYLRPILEEAMRNAIAQVQ